MPSGGYRIGAGRKPKPKDPSTLPESAIQKMKRLKIDPILILNSELKELKNKTDLRSQALRVRICEKLLEYGYSRQPVSTHNEGGENIPILTITKKPSEVEAVPENKIKEIQSETNEKNLSEQTE